MHCGLCDSALYKFAPWCAVTGDTGASPVHSSLPSAVWSPADSSLIKHIPKSARASCASHLALLLGKVVANPNSAANWLELFNWGNTVLHPPKRGGRRHKLGKTIKYRSLHTVLVIVIMTLQILLSLLTSIGTPQPHLARPFQLSWKMAMSGQPFVF